MQYTCSYSSPLGEMLIASDGSAVTGLWFIGQNTSAALLKRSTLKSSAGIRADGALA